MKKEYVKPVIESEEFVANEYVALCWTGYCNEKHTFAIWDVTDQIHENTKTGSNGTVRADEQPDNVEMTQNSPAFGGNKKYTHIYVYVRDTANVS